MGEQVDVYESEGVIKIKPNAYITMLKHVLTYGNKALGPDSVEVMGICMGKEEGDDMVIHEAIPVSHGNAIEVGFTPSDYAAFAQIDEEYANKDSGLYACGWYHSHPGMKAFLSRVDIKNHLFYQKEQTPKGFAIVFDHEYLDEPGNPGFKAFRLDDYSKGVDSDFHESKFKLLTPDDPNIYLEIMRIIEASQAKKPIIQEVSALSADDGIWTVDEDDEDDETETEEKPEEKEPIDEIKDAAEDGMEAFTKEFTSKFLDEFDEFKDDTKNAAETGASVLVDTIVTMKELVDRGVSRIKEHLEIIMDEEYKSVNEDLDKTFEKMDTAQREFNKEFYEFSDKVTKKVGTVITDLLTERLDKLIKIIKDASANAKTIGEQSQAFKDDLYKQQEVLENLKKSLEENTSSVQETIKNLKDKIGSETAEQSKMISDSFNDLKSLTDEINEIIKDLQGKVS